MVRRRTTLKDVAEDVGVHVSTVSRALNPQTRHFIRPEVADRIIEASERLNYRPNAAAYSLRTKKTRIVGVVIPDITNPVFPPIIRGIEDVLSERGYLAILVNSEPASPSHADVIDALQSRGVDGLIMASLESNDRTLRELVASGLPVVTVNRRAVDDDIPSVTNDEEEGIRLILEHLRGLGHRRVVNIAGPQSISTGKARLDAFTRHGRALGFEVGRDLVFYASALNEAEGERCASLALEKASQFTAIVASNDRLAVGAISLLRQRGLACPGDISVTGFNDMPMVDRYEPPLTTIRVQQYEVGRLAAAMLLRRLEGAKVQPGEDHVVMPVELVVRASTARARRLAAVAG
jgi:LacI family transcriptional regulator